MELVKANGHLARNGKTLSKDGTLIGALLVPDTYSSFDEDEPLQPVHYVDEFGVRHLCYQSLIDTGLYFMPCAVLGQGGTEDIRFVKVKVGGLVPEDVAFSILNSAPGGGIGLLRDVESMIGSCACDDMGKKRKYRRYEEPINTHIRFDIETGIHGHPVKPVGSKYEFSKPVTLSNKSIGAPVSLIESDGPIRAMRIALENTWYPVIVGSHTNESPSDQVNFIATQLIGALPKFNFKFGKSKPVISNPTLKPKVAPTPPAKRPVTGNLVVPPAHPSGITPPAPRPPPKNYTIPGNPTVHPTPAPVPSTHGAVDHPAPSRAPPSPPKEEVSATGATHPLVSSPHSINLSGKPAITGDTLLRQGGKAVSSTAKAVNTFANNSPQAFSDIVLGGAGHVKDTILGLFGKRPPPVQQASQQMISFMLQNGIATHIGDEYDFNDTILIAANEDSEEHPTEEHAPSIPHIDLMKPGIQKLDDNSFIRVVPTFPESMDGREELEAKREYYGKTALYYNDDQDAPNAIRAEVFLVSQPISNQMDMRPIRDKHGRKIKVHMPGHSSLDISSELLLDNLPYLVGCAIENAGGC